jgi:hypothetical protein
VVFLGTLNSSILFCQYSAAGTVPPVTDGYYNLTPVFDWIHCIIISILLVFMIAFLPLFTQGMHACLYLVRSGLNTFAELVGRGTGVPLFV